MSQIVLLSATIVLISGCITPLPEVYLSQNPHNLQLSPQLEVRLSRIVVVTDDFSDASGEISDFVHQKLSASLTKLSDLSDGSFIEMSLVCHFEASRSAAFAEPLPEGVWVSVRFDLTEPASHQITRSLRFEHSGSSEQTMTLQACLDEWLDELSTVLRPVTVRHPYTLARGVSRHDRRGHKYVEQGNHQTALRSFQKAIDDHPNDHAALYNAGLMCEVLAQNTRALSFYKRAYRISSKQDYQAAIARIENALP